jgi:hypothetical protein
MISSQNYAGIKQSYTKPRAGKVRGAGQRDSTHRKYTNLFLVEATRDNGTFCCTKAALIEVLYILLHFVRMEQSVYIVGIAAAILFPFS